MVDSAGATDLIQHCAAVQIGAPLRTPPQALLSMMKTLFPPQRHGHKPERGAYERDNAIQRLRDRPTPNGDGASQHYGETR